jgi:SAM-dependent methyltransferase
MGADPKSTEGVRMRRFWDERAQENAAWYVDTSLSYDEPDMDRFFATGEQVVAEALLDAPVQPAGRGLAVEIGPGLGRICRALADHFDRVIGIDVSAEMVAQARQLVAEPRVEFLVGDGLGLRGVEDGSADLVTSFTVLQHLPSRALVLEYLREGARVLRPGGVLAVQWNGLPHPWWWRARAAWWRLRQRVGLGMAAEQRSAREFVGTRVPWAAVERTLRDAGLQVAGRKGEGTLFSWVWAVRP